MAKSKQLGIKEVLNIDIKDFATGDSKFYADYASNTSIEATAERLDLRGGQGNYKLLSFDHTKDMMMRCELPLVDLEFLSYLTGKPLEIGSVAVPKREVLIVGATPELELASTPVSDLKIYILTNDRDNGTEQIAGTPASNENEYSITGATVTLNATTAAEGTKFVVSYKYNTISTETRTMTFTADKFPGYVTINGYGFVTDQVDGNDYAVVFECLKAKPKNNWTISLSSTEATVLNIEFDLYSVDTNDGNGGIDKVYVKMHELV